MTVGYKGTEYNLIFPFRWKALALITLTFVSFTSGFGTCTLAWLAWHWIRG